MACQLLIPLDLLKHYSSEKSPQQSLMLTHLRMGPLNTITARRELGIMSPSARVNELRSLGYPIRTTRISTTEEDGRHHHRVALYLMDISQPGVLLPLLPAT